MLGNISVSLRMQMNFFHICMTTIKRTSTIGTDIVEIFAQYFALNYAHNVVSNPDYIKDEWIVVN